MSLRLRTGKFGLEISSVASFWKRTVNSGSFAAGPGGKVNNAAEEERIPKYQDKPDSELKNRILGARNEDGQVELLACRVKELNASVWHRCQIWEL